MDEVLLDKEEGWYGSLYGPHDLIILPICDLAFYILHF